MARRPSVLGYRCLDADRPQDALDHLRSASDVVRDVAGRARVEAGIAAALRALDRSQLGAQL